MAKTPGKNKDDKPGPQANMPPAAKKFVKKGIAYSPVKTGQQNDTNEIQVFVLKILSGDMLMLLEKNKNAPYIWPVHSYFEKHPKLQEVTLSIHAKYNRVSTTDSEGYLETVSATGFKKHFPVYISILSTEQELLNTTKNRRAWANAFIHFFNTPEMQNQYKFKSSAVFAGDITPTATAPAPALADYVTLRDTMETCRMVLQGGRDIPLPSIGDVLEQDGLMQMYYGGKTAEAQRRFTSFRNPPVPAGQEDEGHHNDGEAAEQEEGVPNIPAFTLRQE